MLGNATKAAGKIITRQADIILCEIASRALFVALSR